VPARDRFGGGERSCRTKAGFSIAPPGERWSCRITRAMRRECDPPCGGCSIAIIADTLFIRIAEFMTDNAPHHARE